MLTASLPPIRPPEFDTALTRYLDGDISGELALMHLVVALGDARALAPTLKSVASLKPPRRDLADLVRLCEVHADELTRAAALLERGLLELPSAADDGIAFIRDQFEKAVATSPEASVALYSLGSAEILERATAEILARLNEWKLLTPRSIVLDVGCGIGRFERALAPQVGAITGIDVSPSMIAEAQRRCHNLANVVLKVCGGRDLVSFVDRSIDLVLAVDSFPYLFAANPAIAARHVRDASRLMRPGGALLILNFSYRGDSEADRADAARLASANDLVLERAGTRDFALWDGVTFLLRKKPAV
ncbi:MAG: class I SAM-dependent methyltransferase [Burkholderiales bacterium]